MKSKVESRKKIDEYLLTARNNEKLLLSIHKISNLLTRPVALDKILTAIVRETSNVFGFSRVAIFLKDRHNDLLECKYLIGFRPHEKERALSMPFNLGKHDCIETMTVKSGKIMYIKDYHNDKRVTEIDLRVSTNNKRVSTLAIPLKIKKDVIGLIEADRDGVKMNVTNKDIKSFSIFANQASIIIENARLQVRNKKRIEQLLSWQEIETDIVGSSPGIRNALEMTRRIAKSNDTTVLIEGETGTGKEIFARAVHYHSNRVGKPYISINCGAISRDLVESELFGYEKGTFTGGLQEGKKGKFELADGGTLLLDEVSELLPFVQVKLLRFLEEREFYPVGGTEKKRVNVRIIAATNKSLEQEIRLGNFREDLYYRLNVAKILLPPLRERKEDIVPIALYFVNRFNINHGKIFSGISKGAQAVLRQHPWVGNIRELRNVIERVVVMEEGPLIEEHHLIFLNNINENNPAGYSSQGAPAVRPTAVDIDPGKRMQVITDEELLREGLKILIRRNSFYPDVETSKTDTIKGALMDFRIRDLEAQAGAGNQNLSLDEVNRNLLSRALQASEGNKAKAAKLLGITRAAAVYRIKKYGLNKKA